MSMEQLRASAAFIAAASGGFAPEVALVLGSGLGYLAEQVEQPIVIRYADIPHFAAATAPGHAGNLVLGLLGGRRVALMQGRLHYYEGNSFEAVVYLLRVLRLLGADKLIITNAAGCVETSFAVGDIMLITDHIKFFDESPLRGANVAELGPRFPDMSYAYTPRLRETAREVARQQALTLREGVYMYFSGPQYETPAEIRAARVLGAQAVGMSTVPEVIAAVHAGYEVLGLSVLCNMAAGVVEQRLTEQDVLDAAAAVRPRFARLVLGCLERLP